MPSASQAPRLTAEEVVEIQQTEIEALQSILDQDFCKVEHNAWRNAQAPQLHEFEITLRPDEERLKPLVSAVVNFKLPKNYPINAPTISLKPNDGRIKGLSAKHVRDLNHELSRKARELVGAEMIWELVSLGQDYVSQNNLAPKEARDGVPSVSLEEEKRQRALDEEKRERERQDEEKRRRKEADAAKTNQLAQAIQQEASKKAMVLKRERDRQRTLTSNEAPTRHDSTPQNEGLVSNEWLGGSLTSQRIETFLEPFEEHGRVISILRLGPVLEKTDLCVRHLAESGHDDPSETTVAGSWVLEHYFISSIHYAYSAGKRKIEEIEWELDKLAKIRERHLVNVLASAVTRMGDNEGWKLSVVLEKSSGVPLRTLLEQCEVLPWRRVRHYLGNLLEALESLHSRNLFHRSVCLDCICIESAGVRTNEVKATVRIKDGCYVRRLRDMHKSNPLNDSLGPLVEEEQPRAWKAPESIEQPLTYTRKRDLWDLGVCACQMLFGIDCRIEHEAPEHLLRSADELPAHVRAFLMLMLERSPKKRPTTAALAARLEEMIVFEDQEWSQESTTRKPTDVEGNNGVASSARSGPGRNRGNSLIVPAASPAAELGTSPPRDQSRPGAFWPLRQISRHGSSHQGVGVSRYMSDFEEVEFLGKGAFGSVVKARNRLDGRFYAVKKIKLSSSPDEDERTLREITALSRLDHPHVVRYTTCWIEETHTPLTGLDGSDTDGMTASLTLETNTTSATGPSGPSLASVKGAKYQPFDDSFRATPNFDNDFLSAGDDAFSQSNSFSDIRFANDDDDSDNSDVRPKSSNAPGGDASAKTPLPSSGDNDSDDIKSDDVDTSGSEDSTSSDDEDDEDNDDFSRIPGVSRRGSKQGPKQGLSMSSMALSKSNRDFVPVQRVLYIQMEFVENRTLREAIDRGVGEDEAWRILRQMVEALAHISSLGIIHRDLKPSNVLLYANGDVKIGDFGLATNAMQIAEGGAGVGGTADLGDSTDLTGDLGTFLYTAPELRAKKGARYNFKVDIYSLGIIFFEMLASQTVYRTGMERILLIRELRTPSVSFPSAWPRSKYDKQTTLIQQMLDHNPDRRPSPLEILRSDLLPPKMEDEYIEECLRLMANPSSAYNHQLMDALFGRTAADVVRDFTYDTGSQTDQDNALVGVVCDLIRSVCRKHGAVEFSAPLLVPPNGLYQANEKVVQVLDKTGKVVHLPYDLTVPFARIFARSDNQRFKRYEIGNVYRENIVAGGQPRAVLASSFDIVSPERSAAAEAEALAVVDEMINEIPGVASESWDIHINHESILALILERVPGKHRDAVLGIAALLAGSKSFNSARSQLVQLGLPRSIIEELVSFNLQDELKTVHSRLERLFPIEHRSRVSKGVAEIAEVVATAQHFGVQRRFIFTPLLAQSSKLYKGGVFFTVVRAGKRRDVVAAGGRYDHLLKKFSNPSTSSASLHGVGVQIAVGKVTLGLAKYQEVHVPRLLSRAEEERSFGFMTPRRCDVYVASAPGLLHTRMEICRELWAHNISADLQYEHATYDSAESAAATCRSEGILLLVFAKARSPVLKVKMVLQRAEYEVSRHELVSFVQDKMARQRSIDAQVAGSGWITSASSRFQQSYGDSVSTRAGGASVQNSSGIGSSFAHGHHHPSRGYAGTDVLPSLAIPIKEREMVLPERPIDRSKKGDKSQQNRPKPSSRQLVLDKASRQVSRFADQLQGGHVPVLAVDFSGSSFDRLAAALMACLGGSGLHSGTSGTGTVSGGGGGRGEDEGAQLFRTFLEGLSTEEKDYARLIKAKAVEFAFPEENGNGHAGSSAAVQGCGRVFLYSLREDRTALVGCGR